MSNKALEACVKYEQARKEIQRLTRKIGDACEVECEDQRMLSRHPLDSDDCLSRLWEHNKEMSMYDEREAPTLCHRCAQIDDLVQRRKQAKKAYGIAKRRVSAIGRASLGGS